MRLFFPGADQSSPQRTHFLILLISTSLNGHSGGTSSGSTDLDFDLLGSSEVDEAIADVGGGRGAKWADVVGAAIPVAETVTIDDDDEVDRLSGPLGYANDEKSMGFAEMVAVGERRVEVEEGRW